MSLRPITENDLPLVRQWRNSPEVRQWMFNQHLIEEAEHRAWFERIRHDPGTLWLIHENKDGEPDGVVGFSQIDKKDKQAQWGIYAAPAAPRGTGTLIGIEALDYAFMELNLLKLDAEVIAENEASVNFHLKLGFRKGACSCSKHLEGGRCIEVLRMSILAEEWQAKREALLVVVAGGVYGSRKRMNTSWQ